jgi:hypothetical protein
MNDEIEKCFGLFSSLETIKYEPLREKYKKKKT